MKFAHLRTAMVITPYQQLPEESDEDTARRMFRDFLNDPTSLIAIEIEEAVDLVDQ